MTSHWGGGSGVPRGGGVQGGGMGASLGGGARPACIGANLKAALSRAPRSLFFLLVDFCPRTFLNRSMSVARGEASAPPPVAHP